MALSIWAMWMMTGFDVSMDSHPVIIWGFVQGLGLGLVFVPLSTLTFATIAQHYRGDATAMFGLLRNLGSGVGISIVTTTLSRMISVNHADLAGRLTLDAPQVWRDVPGLVTHDPGVAVRVEALVMQKASMIAYADHFRLMQIFTAAVIPIALLLRAAKPVPGQAAGRGVTALAFSRPVRS